MAQSGVSYYVAPIVLTEDLVKGATVSGTINGVQVSGTVKAGYVYLYAITQVLPYKSSGGSLKVAEIDGDAGNYRIALGKQPESDLTIHLTQAIPAHAVTIPEEYLELTETNEAISAAMSAANTAQNAANTAQSAASRAQTTANTAKTTADTAKATANTAKATANTAKTTAETAQSTANTAKTTANNAATKKDPVITGSFSQNRKSSSVIGDNSHAEGTNTTASGRNSHAEGLYTIASGTSSHAEGWLATASGYESHAEGIGTIAQGHAQHVQGQYNIPSGIDNGHGPDHYVHIVGNGSDDARSNAHTLTWSGIPWYKKRPQFGGNAMNDGAQTVVANGDKEIVLASSTSGSTKKFRITVDDTGTIKATEVTE